MGSPLDNLNGQQSWLNSQSKNVPQGPISTCPVNRIWSEEVIDGWGNSETLNLPGKKWLPISGRRPTTNSFSTGKMWMWSSHLIKRKAPLLKTSSSYRCIWPAIYSNWLAQHVKVRQRVVATAVTWNSKGFDMSRVGEEAVDMREGLGLALPKANPLEALLSPLLSSSPL